MQVKRVVAKREVAADRDRIALQRGPFLYCVEGTDNGGEAWNFVATESGPLHERSYQVVNESVIAIEGDARILRNRSATGLAEVPGTFMAIPYYAWANRGNYEMQVWLPTAIETLKING
jgi:DUF1680 family protein